MSSTHTPSAAAAASEALAAPESWHYPLPHFHTRLLPVVALSRAEYAIPLAHALLEGGIDAIEITLRTPAALASIEMLARQVPEMVVGAGTVLRPADLASVRNAGARFALSPGCTPSLLAAAMATPLPFIPGVASASEAMLAQEAGFGLLKCFPAVPLGGVGLLKAWAGPLPELRFCPTGGIGLEQLGAFLVLPNVALVGGSWITPAAALDLGDWAHVTKLARQASAVARAAALPAFIVS
ncbi:2-keto-3-deoxy-6-phosphogluconate aldolase [Serpentinimonas maccroryi]|uniref:2-dehydro-3-deoxy-phosphogluconate aldolase n=1 Tax=Serpentinimonas maccroryi TaxID=1458426 RepID=A0A060NPH7_9BURK|nr:2-keto-3-deoxy-6-phosphogluconate aldolase [Serpentinimonas maccroryi]